MTYSRRFSNVLSEELAKHSSRANRADVASAVYWAMKARGFNLAIVNDRGFENLDEKKEEFQPRRTYRMRRNNAIDCWEVV